MKKQLIEYTPNELKEELILLEELVNAQTKYIKYLELTFIIFRNIATIIFILYTIIVMLIFLLFLKKNIII